MIGADLARAGLHAGLAVLIFTGGASVLAMVLIEMAFGAARAFFQPAFAGLLPQTIPEAEIQDARALTQSTANLAIVVGSALGTLLVIGLGAGEAFALDAASFLLSAVLLIRVTPRERGEAQQVGGVGGPETTLPSLRDGWSEVRSRPWVWVTIAAFTGIMLTDPQRRLGRAEHPVRARRPARRGRGQRSGGRLRLLAVRDLVGDRPGPAHPGAGPVRASAYDWMGSLALLPLGFVIAGPLANAFGARWVLAAGAVFSLLMLSPALLPRSTRELSNRPSAQELDGDVAEERGGEAQVAHIDPLIGVVHKRRGFE